MKFSVGTSSGKKFNYAPKESGEDEVGPVPQGSMVRLGPRDHRELKAHKEFWNLPVPKATNCKVLKDPRAILVNPSQLLLFYCVTYDVHSGKSNWYSLIAVRC